MQKNNALKRYLGMAIMLIIFPAATVGGFFLFRNEGYLYLSVCLALVAMLPFFISFENKKSDAFKAVLLAVMVALAVLGRFVFGFIPHFKPVTAIVVIAGLYLGAESGFLCGALSALLSNFFFGQGVWTPFQMLTWGLIGCVAGLISGLLKKNTPLLLIYGFLSGVIFSLVMDAFSALWLDGYLNWTRYWALVISALPITLVYGVSNVIFLVLLVKPLGKKLDRIFMKYGNSV